MISSFCLYLSFSWGGRILKKTSLILTTYYLELGLNIHGWKKPLFDHCKRGTASKQPPRSLLRTARRKKKAQRPTHAYSKALECAAQARARKHGAACSLVRAYLESETTAVRFHLEIRSSCTRARASSGGPVNLSAATRAASMNMIRKCSKSSAVYLNW